MNNWKLPALAIAGFFAVISFMLSQMDGHKPGYETKTVQNNIKSEIRELKNSGDSTSFKAPSLPKITKATSGDLVPAFGSLQAIPKPEVTTFKGTTTNKKDDKKKKKLAKKDKKKKSKLAKKQNKSQPLVENEEPSDESFETTGDGNPAGSLSTKVSKLNRQNPQTVEDWVDKISNPPSSKEIMEFLKLYNAKFISEQIFYGVTLELLKSSNSQVRKFAYIALASTPSLNSFVQLGMASEKENSDELNSFISQSFETYWSLQYLGILPAALSSNSQGARYYAAVSIGQSAQLNMRNVAGNQTPGRGRPTSPVYSQSYTGLQSNLERTINSDPNESVRAAARQALEIIRSLSTPVAVASN